MTLVPHPLDVEQEDLARSGRAAGTLIGIVLLAFGAVLLGVLYLLARMGQ